MGLHRSIYRRMPEQSRHWHNPKDPVQAERIAAAQGKRDRKGQKREADANSSIKNNMAHRPSGEWVTVPRSLNPFFIAREVV